MKFGIIGNTNKPIVKDVAANLIDYFRKKHLSFVVHDELGRWMNGIGNRAVIEDSVLCKDAELSRRSDILIALGGDGTMLAAARMVNSQGTPILGVNLGKLGFLAEVSVDEVNECLDDILAGSYIIEERMAVTARTNRDDKEYFALNEVVVDRGSSPRVVDLETSVNGEYLITYAADGIIITTPTGSTAYSLASGGPIVVPQSKVLTINPISPHTLTARPVIVPDGSVIRVVIHAGMQPVHITADGQIEGFYEPPVEFTMKRAPHLVKLVKRKKRSYFDLLRAKLLWGRDLRLENNE